MPTCNLVVRVRARQMNRSDTRIDDPLRRPDRIACSFWTCSCRRRTALSRNVCSTSSGPAQLSVLVKGITELW